MPAAPGPDDGRLRRAFLEESEELVQKLGESLSALETAPESRELVNEIFRLTHSLKSEAALMGYTSLSGLAHLMEDVLGQVRSGDLALSRDVLDRLVAGADRAAVLMNEISQSGKESESGAEEVVNDQVTPKTGVTLLRGDSIVYISP